MRFGRLDIGLARMPKTKKIAWDWRVSLLQGACGCLILSIGPVWITYLSSLGGCYEYQIIHLKKKKRGNKTP